MKDEGTHLCLETVVEKRLLDEFRRDVAPKSSEIWGSRGLDVTGMGWVPQNTGTALEHPVRGHLGFSSMDFRFYFRTY